MVRHKISLEIVIGLICLLPFLSGCGTSKGYVGEKQPIEQLATVYGSHGGGFKVQKMVRIEKSDEKELGSEARGFPAQVQVLPGRRVIAARYYEYHRLKGLAAGLAGGVGGVLGGAVVGASVGAMSGAAAAGAASVTAEAATLNALGPAEDPYRLRHLSFEAVAGQTYVIEFTSDAASPQDVDMWIENDDTGEVVSREIDRGGVAFPKVKKKEMPAAVANASLISQLLQSYYERSQRWPKSQEELKAFNEETSSSAVALDWSQFAVVRFTPLNNGSLAVAYRFPPYQDDPWKDVRMRIALPDELQLANPPQK